MNIFLTGLGGAVPGSPIPNSAFGSLGVDDEWIASRTGVRTRHHIGEGEALAGLAANAALAALGDASATPESIDFVVAATSTPDLPSPGIAAEIASMIGANGVGAVDVNGACTGFLYALDYAISKIDHGSADKVLVVGADAMTRITDPSDRNTAVLFADGAGAVIVEGVRGECDRCTAMLSFGSDGDRSRSLHVSPETGHVVMDGAEVYMAAIDAMSSELEHVLTSTAIRPEDIAQLACHQANGRIVSAVARRLNWPKSRVLSYIDRFGNTSAASIPIALKTGHQEQKFRDGDTLALAAFGAGFSWGAGVITWKHCRHQLARSGGAS